MELFVELHDADSVVLKTFQHIFDNDDTMKELKREIWPQWRVLPRQLSFFKDGKMLRRPTNRSLQSFDLRNGDKVIARHASISRWIVYKKHIRLMSIQGSDKLEHAKEAHRHGIGLNGRGFFEVYPHLKGFEKEAQSEVTFWTDDDIVSICEATKQFFRNLHDQKRGNEDSEFTCYFEKRDEEFWSRSTSIIAFVRIHGEKSVSKYNVKCAHRFGPRIPEIGEMPDITQLWCYKLLELIDVGPKCHIIPPKLSTRTRTRTYVVTLWNDEFDLLADMIDENSLCAEVVVQLELLRVLLFIYDFSEENCGRWKGTKNAAIVGFAMSDSVMFHSDNKNEIIERTMIDYRWRREYSAVKSQHDKKSWLAITKTYLEKWDLPRKIELAREQFDPNKTLLEILETYNKNWHHEYSPTEDLDEYIDTLYRNVENLQTLLNLDD